MVSNFTSNLNCKKAVIIGGFWTLECPQTPNMCTLTSHDHIQHRVLIVFTPHPKTWKIEQYIRWESLFICHHLDKSLWLTNQKQQLGISLLYHIPAETQPSSSTNWLVLTGTMFKSWYLANSRYNLKHYNPISLLHHDSFIFMHQMLVPPPGDSLGCQSTSWVKQTLTPTKKVASYFLQMVVMMMVFLQTWFLEIESGLGWSSIYTHPFFTFLSNASSWIYLT
jgi:hypothetical protein